ncbi:hypothetical protein NW762_012490 [Fusarium torreyae]|uniref:Succinyl-CoA:3-ketoacid-coenzyme A transferase n=1 Tax=Fusarium torreyae TaxID=1237075 RepID=A0A9W8RP30_9HYPO|nr:hypothetical protein NW762_012490 [Fusarium torreyae]
MAAIRITIRATIPRTTVYGGIRSFSHSPGLDRINKICESAAGALRGVQKGSTVLVGGFGFSGVPSTLINALRDLPHVTDLTVVSNNAGMPGVGLGQLLETKQIKRMIASYIGENKLFEKLYLTGQLELELTPQGTMAEKIRSGAAGIPAFYTPAGIGTVVESGELPVKFNQDGTVSELSRTKEVRVFGGKHYMMEEAIFGHVALVKVNKADRLGNCQFRRAQNNFNEAMGKNAHYTVVEADEIVEVGDISPEDIHLQGIYVDKVVLSTEAKKIEKITYQRPAQEVAKQAGASGDAIDGRMKIIRRAAKELKHGMYVNLGIGIPLAAPAYVADGIEVTIQSENGILGMGRYPAPGEEDPDLINAGKETVTLNPGASLFGSHESFGMVRSGRINLTMLGALQVAKNGGKSYIANFMLPGKVKGIGGAMDLVANPGKTRVVVTMDHVNKKGNPKILNNCTFPLTGRRCVSRIITELAVFDVAPEGLELIEIANGVSIDDLKAKTEATFRVSQNLKAYQI